MCTCQRRNKHIFDQQVHGEQGARARSHGRNLLDFTFLSKSLSRRSTSPLTACFLVKTSKFSVLLKVTLEPQMCITPSFHHLNLSVCQNQLSSLSAIIHWSFDTECCLDWKTISDRVLLIPNLITAEIQNVYGSGVAVEAKLSHVMHIFHLYI